MITIMPVDVCAEGETPVINSVTITGRSPFDKESDGMYLYNDIYFEVDYQGSDRLEYSVEQENTVIVDDYISNEHPIAHGEAKNIVTVNYAWADIKVSNAYGEAKYRLEIPPYYVSGVSEIAVDASAYDAIEVYSLTGSKLATVDVESALSELKKGIYLVCYLNGGEVVKVCKKAVR